MITIALADDESITREALRCLLEREPDFRVVGHALIRFALLRGILPILEKPMRFT